MQYALGVATFSLKCPRSNYYLKTPRRLHRSIKAHRLYNENTAPLLHSSFFPALSFLYLLYTTQTMETFCLSSTLAPNLPWKLTKSASQPLSGPRTNNRHRPIKPFIRATLSQPEEEKKNSSAFICRAGGFGSQFPFGRELGEVLDQVVRADSETGEIDAMGYLTGILSSKVYDVAVDSPLDLATKVSERLGTNVWLKREDRQSVFSFKLRGAYNMMAKMPRDELERGVICASAGNHAQGVALAGRRLGCDTFIVMPTTTPEIKIDAVRRLGGQVIPFGDDFDASKEEAIRISNERNIKFIPPFDDPDIIMGQGTVGVEIVRQMQERGPLSAIFIPVGGGGLIAGIAAYVKRVMPEVKIIGVEPVDANSMQLSLEKGEIVTLDEVGSFADGVAVKQVGEENFRICKELVDDMVLVDDAAMSAAIKDVYEETRSILEPSGALSLAGAEAYCKQHGITGEVVAVTSGANMDFNKLKLVVDLAEVGRGREAVLVTVLPEKPGSLKQFCEQVGETNLTELKYRYSSDKDAVILYSAAYNGAPELEGLKSRLDQSRLETYDLSKNGVVQEHLRYLTGGRSDVPDEVLCRFVFPEKPGALKKLLDAMSPRWNVSLINYRISGDTTANVLAGFQVSPWERGDFQKAANDLGYQYKIEDSSQFGPLIR